jgi:hypothetical protein
MSNRTGEKLFGVLAILGGLAIIAGAALGWTAGPLLLALVNLVVIGWVVYFFAVKRPREQTRRTAPH